MLKRVAFYSVYDFIFDNFFFVHLLQLSIPKPSKRSNAQLVKLTIQPISENETKSTICSVTLRKTINFPPTNTKKIETHGNTDRDEFNTF